MPDCPDCERPMATVLKREGGVVRTSHECSYCKDEGRPEQPQEAPTAPEEDGPDVRN